MQVYNTLSRKKEELILPEKAKMFVCGPTVYNFIHLGNARSFTNYDLIAKYLRYKKIDLFYLENITDIDDKIIKKANREKTDWKEIARRYEKAFLEDISKIRITAVNKYARATDYIDNIVSQVKRLLEKGYAYTIENDGIYYDLSKNKEYGKLSRRTYQEAEDAVSRIDESTNKRNKGDFCLWKFSKPDEPFWETELGKGRPGWHIEDTAITEKEFGPQYDIHGGGIDLIFPHHEAEIAQMESITGKKPFVKYWIHSGFLNINKEKMAKSGTFITLREALQKYNPLAIRYFFISAHYRAPLDFSKESIKQAESALNRIQEFYENAKDSQENIDQELIDKTKQAILNALDDDFNTPKAFGELFTFIRKANKLGYGKNSYELLKELDQIFDILTEPTTEIPENIKKLAEKREIARKNKDFELADKLRDEIKSLGYLVEDSPTGPKLKKQK